jgi:hypothetical protein
VVVCGLHFNFGGRKKVPTCPGQVRVGGKSPIYENPTGNSNSNSRLLPSRFWVRPLRFARLIWDSEAPESPSTNTQRHQRSPEPRPKQAVLVPNVHTVRPLSVPRTNTGRLFRSDPIWNSPFSRSIVDVVSPTEQPPSTRIPSVLKKRHALVAALRNNQGSCLIDDPSDRTPRLRQHSPDPGWWTPSLAPGGQVIWCVLSAETLSERYTKR